MIRPIPTIIRGIKILPVTRGRRTEAKIINTTPRIILQLEEEAFVKVDSIPL
jgi:hypothetical protein